MAAACSRSPTTRSGSSSPPGGQLPSRCGGCSHPECPCSSMVTHEVYKQVETRSSNMRQGVGETLADSRLELWRRAKTHSDLQAWAAFQQCLEETVLSWLYDHPGSEAAC